MAESTVTLPQPPSSEPRLEKLNAADWRVILLWILAAAIAIGVAARYYFKAFPEASVNFQVPKSQALETARQFCISQGAHLEGYESSIIFNVDEEAKTYLERTVGLEQSNKLFSSPINGWFWTVRFFRPQQHEEYRVRITPTGKIAGYSHIIDESRSGPKLDRDSAAKIAFDFLSNRYGADLGNYDFLPEEANPVERPARRDWTFTWQRKNFRVPDNPNGANYRIEVTIQGDQPGYAAEFLKVPAEWVRGYEKLRSSNNLVETFAIIPYFILYGAAFWVIFELSKLGLLRWAAPVKVGLILAGLWFLNSVNGWPNLRAEYNTNSSYSAFFFNQVMVAALFSLLQGLLVVFAFAPGEAMYRLTQPDRLQLKFALRLPGLRSKEFFRASIVGICLAAVHIGYIVVFYIIAQHFGAWAPQDVNYTDSMSTSLPWLEAMVIGFYAASSEEFLFRLFAIPFLKRITKSQVLAVVLPAFAWSFLHANYPQEPAYIRGLEIGIMGIVAGIVFLRWGIIATFVWHYTVDATLGSLLLLRTASPYLRISGALVSGLAFIPLVIAGVMYVLRGGFEVREEALNSAAPLKPTETAVEAEAVEEPAVAYKAISTRNLATVAILAVAGIALAFAVHPKSIGSFISFKMDSREAAARADSVLREGRLDPSKYRRTVINNFNLDNGDGELVTKFLVQKLGVDATNRIYETQVPQAFWRVRYFQDGKQDEYAIIFRADGTLHSIWHTQDDKAPGVNLTKEQALQVAGAWLVKFKNLDLSKWRFVSADSEKRPNRTDHTFVWEQIDPIAGGPDPNDAAFIRMELHINGNDISQYRVYVKLPEEWVREQNKSTLRKSLLTAWPAIFISALGVIALIVFFKEFKRASGIVPWRRFAAWAVIACGAFVVTLYTGFPQTQINYKTDNPYGTFLAGLAVGYVLTLVVLLGALSLALGLAYYFFTRAGQEPPLSRWRNLPAIYFRDSLIVGISGAAIWMGYGHLRYILSHVIAPRAADSAISHVGGLDSLHPAIQQIAMSVFQSVGGIAVFAGIAAFIVAFVKPTWLRGLFFIGAAVALVSSEASASQFALSFLFSLISFAIIAWGIAKIVRFNAFGYFLIFVFLSLVPTAFEWLRQPDAYIHSNAITLFVAIGLFILFPLMLWLRGDAKPRAAAPVLAQPESQI